MSVSSPGVRAGRFPVPARSGLGWIVTSGLIALLAVMPIAALVVLAFGRGADLWPHLIANVIPRSFLNTVVLMTGVGALTAMIGSGAAWLVTGYRFAGRRHLEWALLLPLAVPTYIVAYAYLDVLHPLGVAQTWLRWLLGYQSAREFRLPDVRSMTGCILVLSFVLYPYVYITTRAMFLTQAANLVDVSRTLGESYFGAFRRVVLPMARPAIAIGTSLVLMETLNDVGAAQFLGVQTLTVSIYSTWVTRSNLAGAAQISLALLMLVVLLVVAERWARRHQRYAASAQRPRAMEPRTLKGPASLLALALGLLPVIVGFAVPSLYLVVSAAQRIEFSGISPRIVAELQNTLAISAAGTAIALVLGLLVAYAARLVPEPITRVFARCAMLGYAVPGTVLGLGILFPVAGLDQMIDRASLNVFGVSPGLLLLGSGTALALAYTLRFLAISTGGIEAGLSRIPPSFDGAARTLGAGPLRMLARIHLPLTKTAMAAAAILIFVDCMKELPATLLLRPLNFETLATHLYGEAIRGTYEDASVAALLIVLAGIIPVVVLARVGRNGARPS
jgi:iron(III) transport system permease protein